MVTRLWKFIKGAFASSGDKQDILAIPDIAQPNRASYQDGIPSVCSDDKASGGLPPQRKDFNGLFNILTANLQQIQGGMYPTFDTAMTVAPQTGYAKGAVLYYDLEIASGAGYWVISTKDNNTDNFITTPSFIGTSWIPADSPNAMSRTLGNPIGAATNANLNILNILNRTGSNVNDTVAFLNNIGIVYGQTARSGALTQYLRIKNVASGIYSDVVFFWGQSTVTPFTFNSWKAYTIPMTKDPITITNLQITVDSPDSSTYEGLSVISSNNYGFDTSNINIKIKATSNSGGIAIPYLLFSGNGRCVANAVL